MEKGLQEWEGSDKEWWKLQKYTFYSPALLVAALQIVLALILPFLCHYPSKMGVNEIPFVLHRTLKIVIYKM